MKIFIPHGMAELKHPISSITQKIVVRGFWRWKTNNYVIEISDGQKLVTIGVPTEEIRDSWTTKLVEAVKNKQDEVTL